MDKRDNPDGANKAAEKTYLSGTAADQPADAERLAHKRVLMFLASGFEDAEAAVALDVLGWTQYRPSVATVKVAITGLHAEVTGAFGTRYRIDVPIDETNAADFDALVVPGGFHNLGFDEAYCDELRRLAREIRAEGKPIATMCVGILPVAEAGVLAGGRATTYRLSSRHDNAGRLHELGCEASDEPVVDCDGIISCSGPAWSEQVAKALLERLVGPEAAAEVARYRHGM